MMSRMDIKMVTVIGAGTMGRGIAHVAAVGGFKTTLNDVSEELLQKAQSSIQKDLLKAVELGKINTDVMGATLGRLKLETSLERAVLNADIVIEAIPERI